MKRFRYLALGILVLVSCLGSISGCTPKAKIDMMVKNMIPIMDATEISMYRGPDTELVKQAFPTTLVQIEGLLELDPNNEKLLVRASRAYYNYAFLFIESEDKNHAAQIYQKARGYGFDALLQKKAFSIAFSRSEKGFTNALTTLNKKDIPALYYTVASWLAYLNLNQAGTPDSFMETPKIKLMLDRIIELDNKYQYGAAYAMLGVYFATSPEPYGDAGQANFNFNQAFDISKRKYLIWQLLYAKYFTIRIQNKELFQQYLNKIIEAPDNLSEECNIENGVAKVKAQKLLDNIEYYF